MRGLTQKRFAYHCAPAWARASIRKHGIDPVQFPKERSTTGSGFYAFLRLSEAEWYASYMADMPPIESFDIWRVPLSFFVKDDSLVLGGDDVQTTAVYCLDPAKKARRIKTVERKQRE
jgi:hypothetical protein